MDTTPILQIVPLGNQWPCLDPFLFCAYHLDDYPAGNGRMGPKASLEGRAIGSDFAGVNGWNMYHGDAIPGFPQHPHRGFETVTIARSGIVDHADSLGAAARFGEGDAQWITAGRGLSHSEMFPLLKEKEKNPLDLFQIWLNLPKKNKLVDPYFAIFWDKDMAKVSATDVSGKKTQITIIAGELNGKKALAPPPHSWASEKDSDVAIWTLKMEPGAEFTLPPTKASSGRTIYFFQGVSIKIGEKEIAKRHAIQLKPDQATTIVNGPETSEILMLQGRPIKEPVARHGPFVMNTQAEIQEAFRDYQNTLFGGWPWKDDAPVHPKDKDRFAKYPDGKFEKP